MTHYPPVSLTRTQGVLRALRTTDQKGRYRLGQGGRNPLLNGPWSERLGYLAADCSAGAAYWVGRDRWYDDGTPDGIWFNTDEMVADARKRKGNLLYKLVSVVDEVLPGDLLVYTSDPENGLRKGHVAMIVNVKPGFKRGNNTPGQEWWRFLEVVDISTGRGDTACRKRPHAKLWAKRGYILRFLHWMP